MSFNQQMSKAQCVRVLRWPPSEGLASEKELQMEWKSVFFFPSHIVINFSSAAGFEADRRGGSPGKGQIEGFKPTWAFRVRGRVAVQKERKHCDYLLKTNKDCLMLYLGSRVLNQLWFRCVSQMSFEFCLQLGS